MNITARAIKATVDCATRDTADSTEVLTRIDVEVQEHRILVTVTAYDNKIKQPITCEYESRATKRYEGGYWIDAFCDPDYISNSYNPQPADYINAGLLAELTKD